MQIFHRLTLRPFKAVPLIELKGRNCSKGFSSIHCASAELEDSGHNTTHPYKQIFPWSSKKDFVESVIENADFSKDGVVIIHKPYGIGVHSNEINNLSLLQANHPGLVDSCNYTLQDVIDELKHKLQLSHLTLMKSAPKYASGIAVLGKSDKEAIRYKKCVTAMSGRQFQKFSIITLFPPSIAELSKTERIGIQKIGTVNNESQLQPVIARNFSKNSVKDGRITVVNVKVQIEKLGVHNTSLISVDTTKTTDHFLRIYCADLASPILGDHLFAFRVACIRGVPVKTSPTRLPLGTLPQKLPEKLERALGLDMASDALMVPLHVHLSSYVVKNFYGKNCHLELESPYPSHFKFTAQALKLISNT